MKHSVLFSIATSVALVGFPMSQWIDLTPTHTNSTNYNWWVKKINKRFSKEDRVMGVVLGKVGRRSEV